MVQFHSSLEKDGTLKIMFAKNVPKHRWKIMCFKGILGYYIKYK